MVTEEEVEAYRRWPVMFADGKGFFVQVHAWSNRRVWQYIHSTRGVKTFVDGVFLPDPTPAAIAELLNRQQPSELTAMDIFQLAGNEAG